MKKKAVKEVVFNQGLLSNEFKATKLEIQQLQADILSNSSKIPEKKKVEYKLNALLHQMQEYVKDTNTKEVVNVGKFLEECLNTLNMKHKELAERLELNRPNLSAIINGKRKLNIELAYTLGKVFHTDGKLWLDIQVKNEWIEYLKGITKSGKKAA
jgi:addiction module HigA family antidote